MHLFISNWIMLRVLSRSSKYCTLHFLSLQWAVHAESNGVLVGTMIGCETGDLPQGETEIPGLMMLEHSDEMIRKPRQLLEGHS